MKITRMANTTTQKYRPESLRDFSFSSAVTFPSQRQIRCFYPLTCPPCCLSECLSARVSVSLADGGRGCGFCAVWRRSRELNHSTAHGALSSRRLAGSRDQGRAARLPPLLPAALSVFPHSGISGTHKDRGSSFGSRSIFFVCLAFFVPKTEPDV